MRQQDRDVLKALHGAPQGERPQAAAARLLGWSVRHVRRLRRRLEATGDQALVHGLRRQPSDHRAGPASRAKVLQASRRRSADFGPAFAGEALAEGG